MKRSFLSMLLVACTCLFMMSACNQSQGEESGDSADAPAKEQTTVESKPATTETTPAADANKAAGADAAAEADDTPKTKIEFAEMTHDFGTIDEGDKVSHVFKFTNAGEEPLIINSAKGSCGCTVPEWPRDPIAPGGEGEIKVEFNSKGKKNKQTKTVTINANTDPNPTRLTIKADVTPDPNAPAPAAKAAPAGQPQVKTVPAPTTKGN